MAATTLEHLIEARNATAQRLRAATTNPDQPGFLPNANAANTIDHQGFVRTLLETLRTLDMEIKEEQKNVDGPFEVTSEMWAG